VSHRLNKTEQLARRTTEALEENDLGTMVMAAPRLYHTSGPGSPKADRTHLARYACRSIVAFLVAAMA
jgi:hypothetical protein